MNASQVLDLSYINSSVAPTPESPVQSPPVLIAALAAGQPVTLTMTFPPPLTALAPFADALLTTPSFSSSVAWEIIADGRMVEGEDYLILSEGGLAAPSLTLVFKPPAEGEQAKAVTVRATAVVKAVVESPLPSPPPPLPLTTPSAALDEASRAYDVRYSVAPVDPGVLDKLIQGLVDLLYAEVPQAIINPGDVVTARVARRKAPGLPQVVTSLLHDAPSVDIRGSIPLDNVLNFILEPFRKISSLIPSGNPLSKTDDVTANIKKLLPSALTVPVRLNIRGQRLTTAYSPIGDKGPIVFSHTPDEAGDIEGFLPLGRWPLPFSIPNEDVPVTSPPDPEAAGIEWAITYQDPQGNKLAFAQPTTVFGMLRNVLFVPRIQTLGLPAVASGEATIEIKPYLKIDGVPRPPAAHLRLHKISLEVTPIHLPEVLVCFDHGLDNVPAAPGESQVYVSRETGFFAGSLDELLLVLGNLGSALNALISIISTGATQAEPIPNYSNLVYLNQSIKVLSDALRRATSIEFVIADDNKVLLHDVSSFIAIAPRPIRLWARGPQPPFDAVREAHLTIAPPAPAAGAPFYSGFIRNLNRRFKETKPIPGGSAVASNPEYIFHDRIHRGEFNFGG